MSTKPSPPSVKTTPTISRRTFLATSAAAGGALVVGLTLRGRLHQPSTDSLDPFDAWIRIYPDGQIHLVLNNSEMGQGVFTALPMILAEEAEVDFSRITVLQADNVGNAIFAATGKRLRKLPFRFDEA